MLFVSMHNKRRETHFNQIRLLFSSSAILIAIIPETPMLLSQRLKQSQNREEENISNYEHDGEVRNDGKVMI